MRKLNLKTCKKCGGKINLKIFGAPEDICWGCLDELKKKEIMDKKMRTNIMFKLS